MTKSRSAFVSCIRILSFLRHWTFVIRHCFHGHLTKHSEVNDGNNTKPEDKDVTLQISHLHQPQKSADSPCSAATTAHRACVDDPSINKGRQVRQGLLRPGKQPSA